MINLFQMMQAAQGGQAVNNLANQFGLSPQQTQAALEAMLPAFSMGLQKQTETPDQWQNLIGMFGQGQHAGFYDADGDGIPDNAVGAGNTVLGNLFGSKDVSRAVAQQAAAVSGVSDAIIKQMLPVVASMLMGGLFKGAMGAGLGGLLAQVMQGGLGNILAGQMGQPGQQPGPAMPGGFPGFPQGMPGFPQGMPGFPQGMPGQGSGYGQPSPAPQANNPLGDLMGGMLGPMIAGMFGQKPQPAPAAQADPMATGLDILRGMFDSGRQVQDQYQQNLQAVFDQFVPPSAGRR